MIGVLFVLVVTAMVLRVVCVIIVLHMFGPRYCCYGWSRGSRCACCELCSGVCVSSWFRCELLCGYMVLLLLCYCCCLCDCWYCCGCVCSSYC